MMQPMQGAETTPDQENIDALVSFGHSMSKALQIALEAESGDAFSQKYITYVKIKNAKAE
jgi:hypothetical protein